MSLESDPFNETELLARSLRQDREAFGELVTRYAGSIFNLVSRMVGHGPDADELAQMTFVVAFQELPTFRIDSQFSIWLYRHAVKACHDWLRGRHMEQEANDLDFKTQANGVIEYCAPEHEIPHMQGSEHLERAIQALPPLYREAFILKHVEGLSYEDINEILGVSDETLKMRVYKARTRLCHDLVQLTGEG